MKPEDAWSTFSPGYAPWAIRKGMPVSAESAESFKLNGKIEPVKSVRFKDKPQGTAQPQGSTGKKKWTPKAQATAQQTKKGVRTKTGSTQGSQPFGRPPRV